MVDLKFSVSMCVYGGDNAEHFKTAVESILNQTCPPDEVVIVVDGPVPEELGAVIEGYERNDVFRIMRFEHNRGHGHARRAGLEVCRNELVALMDADDISVPDRFEKQLNAFAADPDVTLVGGQIAEFINDPSNVGFYRIVPESDYEIKEYMKKRCPVNQPSVMFKKSHIENAGGYIDWHCDEDYYLWIRLAQHGYKFINIPDVLVYMRTTESSYQRRGGMKYFRSEAKLQKYMLNNKVIGFGTYAVNVSKRFIVQVLMPNKIRGWAFKKFARKSVK